MICKKLMTDIQYIGIMNMLGEHLRSEYGLTLTQVQGIKNKMNLVVEEMTEEE